MSGQYRDERLKQCSTNKKSVNENKECDLGSIVLLGLTTIIGVKVYDGLFGGSSNLLYLPLSILKRGYNIFNELNMTCIDTIGQSKTSYSLIPGSTLPTTISTNEPYFAPIFNDCFNKYSDISVLEEQGPNVLLFKRGGAFFITPKVSVLQWTSNLPGDLQYYFSNITVNVLIGINNIYGAPTNYASSTVAPGIFGQNGGIAYNPPFLYNTSGGVPLKNIPILIPDGSSVSFSIQFLATIGVKSLTATMPVGFVNFLLNNFRLEIVRHEF